MKSDILSHKDVRALRIQWYPNTPAEVMEQQGAKSYKALDGGIAIRKGGQWKYFEFRDGFYLFTGSTKKLKK